MASKLLLVFSILIYAHWAHAFSYSVSGATRSGAEDEKSPSKITIYGGYAMPTASECVKDQINTCNTCTGKTFQATSGGNAPAPCNEASVYEELPLVVQITSDKTNLTDLEVKVATSSTYSGNEIGAITLQRSSGNTYAFSATWSQIITAADLSFCDSGTSKPCFGTKTLYFGPIKDDKFEEYVTLVITFSAINTANATTKGLAPTCPPASDGSLTSSVASEGLCFFEMYPGDGKAYITDFINGWGSTPADPTTTLNYSNLVMYYAEKTGTSLDALRSIQNNSPNAKIAIAASETEPLAEYKVSGLENSNEDGLRTYCFLPALQDVTGNIYYFLDVQKLLSDSIDFSESQRDRMCASPSEVVGILSDKECFIATVAFGSKNHPLLDILREFRNKYLHPYSWGKKFIHFYYKNGPEWAKDISRYSGAKYVVKAILFPVIAIVYLVLHPIWLFALIFSLGGGAYLFKKRHAKRRAKYQGSAA